MTDTCRFVDCRRAPVKDGVRCEQHLLRWLPREPVEREPEWLVRRRTIGLPAKDYSGGGHAA